tara:strand:+ start:1491 stop:2231 length:741 start_codon:yes stop_codon:yes gene_type:complete
MTTAITNTTMIFDNKLSLCIPRVVSEWANKEHIINKFQTLNVGLIKRVDFVEKTSANGFKYYMTFLHFEEWEDNAATRNIQYKILSEDNSARLVYDEPWYWILLKNNNPLSDEDVDMQERVVLLEQQVENLNSWNSYLYNQLCFIYYTQINQHMNNTVDSQAMESDDDEEVDDNSSIPSLVSDDTDLTVETPRNINYTPNSPPFIVQNDVGRRYQRIINRDDNNNVSVNLMNVFNNEATDNNIRQG